MINWAFVCFVSRCIRGVTFHLLAMIPGSSDVNLYSNWIRWLFDVWKRCQRRGEFRNHCYIVTMYRPIVTD